MLCCAMPRARRDLCRLEPARRVADLDHADRLLLRALGGRVVGRGPDLDAARRREREAERAPELVGLLALVEDEHSIA